jgi:hypothetical protein
VGFFVEQNNAHLTYFAHLTEAVSMIRPCFIHVTRSLDEKASMKRLLAGCCKTGNAKNIEVKTSMYMSK